MKTITSLQKAVILAAFLVCISINNMQAQGKPETITMCNPGGHTVEIPTQAEVDVKLEHGWTLGPCAPLSATVEAGVISCFGGSTTVTVSATGGVAPYTGTGTFTVTAGTYTYTVTDAKGAEVTLTIVVTQPPLLTANAGANATVYYGYAPNACTNLSGTANGGTAPYSYAWSNGSSNASITVCPATTTTYTLTITDANGCIAQSTVIVCAIDVRCEKGGSVILKGQGTKVTICHNAGNNKVQTLCIDAANVSDHLAHGDKLGECGTDASCFNAGRSGEEETATIIGESSVNMIAYPNPMSAKTIIEFTATEDAKTLLEIYDIRGAVVQRIFDAQSVKDQTYRVEWNASDLTDGIYFGKLISNNRIEYIKLVLAK